MKNRRAVVVVGLGEVGRPLFELASQYHRTVGIDIEPSLRKEADTAVLHICFPFQVPDFVGETLRYIEQFRPELTVINSTVKIGTTRQIGELSGGLVVNSPIRGKHARMLEELKSYTKFIGAMNEKARDLAVNHFSSMGLQTRVLSSPEATELAKLSETTYFGLLIAWAQEIERYAEQAGVEYGEVTSFYQEVKYLPRHEFFPGVIGGHCVMPNIALLRAFAESDLLDAIRSSNEQKRLEKVQATSQAVITA